jgi:hypothetical protein
VPIGEGQTISQPLIVAYMTECLELTGGERVLEVGTGSGYQAAILGEIAGEVYSIEIVPSLAQRATKDSRGSATRTSSFARGTVTAAGRRRRRSTGSSSPQRRRRSPAAPRAAQGRRTPRRARRRGRAAARADHAHGNGFREERLVPSGSCR